MIERITVAVNTAALERDDVEMLTTYARENPGNTALQLVFIDATNPHNLLRMSAQGRGIRVKRQLLDDIAASNALSYSINQ